MGLRSGFVPIQIMHCCGRSASRASSLPVFFSVYLIVYALFMASHMSGPPERFACNAGAMSYFESRS
jgi:hypothetical protein